MKDNEYNSDNIIKFKSLAEKLQGLSESGTEDDFDLENLMGSDILETFKEILSEELSESFEDITEESLYKEIVDNYFVLIEELGIDSFNFFRFASYDYSREIIIDKKRFDLDAEFCHDDLIATEALCAIDCLIADIDDCVESILKKVETSINKCNRDE